MIGQVLNGRYEVQERLGGGGMAVVLKAKDRFLGRTVAIKVLRDQFATDSGFLQRFRREAQAVASLSHPNIVPLFDFGQDGETHYLVMEFVEGETLKDKIAREGHLSAEAAVDIAMQILEGLEHAHQRNVVHRDIKPHNIMITPRGRIKVTDFGVARATHGSTLIHTGNIVGSAYYFSPEQARGGPVDARSDLYALGVVLFEMLTGRLPFEGDNPVSVALKHMQEQPPALRDLKGGLPPALEGIVLKSLAKDPARRYQSAGEFRADLEAWRQGEGRDGGAVAGENEQGDPAGTIVIKEELWKKAFGNEGEEGEEGVEREPARRGRWLIWITLLALLVGAAGFGVYTFLRWFQVPIVKVPDVEGVALPQAYQILNKSNLQGRVDAQQHSPDLDAGYVISQNKPAGDEVRQGAVIGLIVSQGPALVEVPDVREKNRFEAENLLQIRHFEVKENLQFDEVISKDYVIDQNPRPGTQAKEGSTVFLQVSLGPPPPPFNMPNLIGGTREDAGRTLEDSGLKPGIERNELSGFPAGIVAGQDPPPGTLVRVGERVDLVVSSGCAATAERTVSVEGFEPVTIRAVVVDSAGQRNIYEQTHFPDQQAVIDVCWDGTPGSLLLIYADGTLQSREVLPQ